MAKDKAAQKEEVAPVADAAAPEAPQMPSLGALGKQFVMLPVLWASNKIDWTQPTAQSCLLCAFGVVVVGLLLLAQTTLKAISRAQDAGRVANPGDGPYMPEKAEDGTVSVQQYDTAKVKELKMQFMMSIGVVTFMHIKFGYTQPLLIMCIMQPMQFWALQAFHIHLRGVAPEGSYARPWAKADANNPLAQWAERKKAEAEESRKATTTKKSD